MVSSIKGLKKYVKNNGSVPHLIERSTIEELQQMLHAKIQSKQQAEDLITIILNSNKNTKHNIDIYRRLCLVRECEFSINEYYEYLDKRLVYPTNNLERYKLLYGSKLGEKKYWDKYKRRGSSYSADVIMKRHNISREEADDKIAKLKARTSGNIDRYINKFGIEEGTRRFNEFVAKSINTFDNFKKWYGDEAETKWQIYIGSKDCSSLKYFITKYGEIDGPIKFKQKIDKSRNDLTRFIKKYNGNIKLAEQKYAEMISKRVHYHKVGAASKESLILFRPIMTYLDSVNVSYRIGIVPNTELYLWSSKYKRSFFYDFVIPELRYIIEYDGCSHAPIEDAPNWRCPYRGISQTESRLLDQRKDEVATEAGYKVNRVYFVDFYKDRASYIDSYLNNIKQLINENKENNIE